MTFSLGLFITFHIFVLIFVVESLRRVWQHKHQLNMPENPRALPFGFLRLRHVIIFFIMAYIGWVFFSIWLYVIFIQGAPGSSSVILRL